MTRRELLLRFRDKKVSVGVLRRNVVACQVPTPEFVAAQSLVAFGSDLACPAGSTSLCEASPRTGQRGRNSLTSFLALTLTQYCDN